MPLALCHAREVQRLTHHLLSVTRAELARAVDDMLRAHEAASATLEDCDWEPCAPAGCAVASPCEQMTWMRQLTVMFSNELCRKELILEALADAAQVAQDHHLADLAREASKRWPQTSAEGCVDAAHLKSIQTTAAALL